MMAVPIRRNTAQSRAAVLIFLLLLGVLAGLSGCSLSGTSPQATRFLAVADSNNNRVLVYKAPFSTNEGANVVLGQTSSSGSTAVLTASGMNLPVAITEDNSGNLYVSDLLNNRVLQFQPPFTTGMNASLVIGQPDFSTAAANTSQSGLGSAQGGPGGLAFDAGGNLWVTDFGNNRVLEFKPPFATNMNASLVIGQPNFTSAAPATSNTGLAGPHYLAFDGAGNLWVADSGNNRVLEFKPPFVTGMAASLVIGQVDFASNVSATTAIGLSVPTGVVFDGGGNLWMSDTGNNRILEFKPPFATGMSASLVLGQGNFTSNAAATTQNALATPFGLGFDSSGSLYVADADNNRTLVFAPPFRNNQSASLVIGQVDFTTPAAATTVTGQSSPFSATAVF
jgi:sugar lactone lactonase YvrE